MTARLSHSDAKGARSKATHRVAMLGTAPTRIFSFQFSVDACSFNGLRIGPSELIPISYGVTSTLEMEAFPMQFEAYHGKTSQHHQSRFNALAPNGWHMISLSAHSDPANPRYSAVWVKEPSPSYIAVHDLPISQYQAWFNTQTSKGFAPVLVTATGGGGNAKVAAVFQKGIKRDWVAKHGLVSGSDLDQNTIEFWCKKARNDGYVLRSGSIYGSASQRLYIAD